MTQKSGGAAGLVLFTLATAQFLMTLDSSVMNVSIAQVAADVGTTVTGIQTAITLYTLVMASMMITGGKIGSLIGRRRAFAIGCVIYACGSFVTSIAQSLTVLIIGWSVLEGLGRGADHAGDRRAGGVELRVEGPPEGVRAGRLRGRHRGGGRAADRRVRHHLLDLALRVRRRGRAGHRHPRAHPQAGRRRAGGAVPPRLRRLRPVRPGPRAGGLRGAALGGVGVGAHASGRSVLARSVTDHLAGPGRHGRAAAVLLVGEPDGRRRS